MKRREFGQSVMSVLLAPVAWLLRPAKTEGELLRVSKVTIHPETVLVEDCYGKVHIVQRETYLSFDVTAPNSVMRYIVSGVVAYPDGKFRVVRCEHALRNCGRPIYRPIGWPVWWPSEVAERFDCDLDWLRSCPQQVQEYKAWWERHVEPHIRRLPAAQRRGLTGESAVS